MNVFKKKTLHSYVLAKAMHITNMFISYIINWLIIFLLVTNNI